MRRGLKHDCRRRRRRRIIIIIIIEINETRRSLSKQLYWFSYWTNLISSLCLLEFHVWCLDQNQTLPQILLFFSCSARSCIYIYMNEWWWTRTGQTSSIILLSCTWAELRLQLLSICNPSLHLPLHLPTNSFNLHLKVWSIVQQMLKFSFQLTEWKRWYYPSTSLNYVEFQHT